MFGVSFDGPQIILILEYCDGGWNKDLLELSLNKTINDKWNVWILTSDFVTFRKFGQIIVWFKWSTVW
jgi:hypothetical protein